jgi:hypothetical protein
VTSGWTGAATVGGMATAWAATGSSAGIAADSTGGTAVEALGEQALSTAPLTSASRNLRLVRSSVMAFNPPQYSD